MAEACAAATRVSPAQSGRLRLRRLRPASARGSGWYLAASDRGGRWFAGYWPGHGHGRSPLVKNEARLPQPVPRAVRPNSVSRIWRGAFGIGVALIAVVGCGTARPADRQGSTAGEPRARTVITIDPEVRETFAPAPASAAPKLTAPQAWARYAARHGSSVTTIPSGVRARLGLLTLPIGPQPDGVTAYTAHGDLAYGYSWPSGCLSTLPGAVPLGARCLSWTFLNANTGRLIDQTWQKLGRWPMPTPSPPMTPAPACATAQLKITMIHTAWATLGNEGGYLRFANEGPALCELHGWPTVIAVTATGKTVRAARAMHGTSLGAWQYVPPLPVLRLKPGASAYAVVDAGDVSLNPRATRCPGFRWLRATPPTGSGHGTLSAHLFEHVYLPDCGAVEVTAVVPLHDLAH